MRLSATLLVAMAFLACGSSSPDVCQRSVTLLEAEMSKIRTCVPDAGPDGGDAGAVNLDGGLHSCELALKSCDGGDLTLLNEELECEEALSSSIECQWYTEADPQADPTYYDYQQALELCGGKAAKISSATCASALP